MNKVLLIGRLTRDAEYKQVNSEGKNLLCFTLAVNSEYIKSDGTRDVNFIPVSYWCKQAEALQKYLTKGKLISVTGRINIKSYVSSDGVKKFNTQILAEVLQFLESNKQNAVNE